MTPLTNYGLGLLELQHLIYPKLLIGLGMLVFFTNSGHAEFQVGYVTLFHLFSLIGSFEWFCIRTLCKNVQLMLEILKAPLLILHSSCNLLMALGMMSRVFPKAKKFAVGAEFPSGSKFLFPKGKYIFAN